LHQQQTKQLPVLLQVWLALQQQLTVLQWQLQEPLLTETLWMLRTVSSSSIVTPA
jgi:hypothetical protein